MSEFLQVLGDRIDMPVIDRTEPNGPTGIPFTAQTELQFEIRKQPVDVWFITEQTTTAR